MKILHSVSAICAGHSFGDMPEDTQGWHSDDPTFAKMIGRTSPHVIVEVGSWKGASALHMAKLAPDAIIICVDTWLGSIEHMATKNGDPQVQYELGFPTLHRQFLRNIADKPQADRIYPLPQTSLNAAKLIGKLGVEVDLVYLDGDHSVNAVYADICAYWKLLRKGGIIFGDDFGEEHLGVTSDVTRFVAENPNILEQHGRFWSVTKG